MAYMAGQPQGAVSADGDDDTGLRADFGDIAFFERLHERPHPRAQDRQLSAPLLRAALVAGHRPDMVMAHVVMAYIVMAYIVMTYVALCSYGPCSYG